MKTLSAGLLLAAATALVTNVAFADVAPDPCEGKSAGDACETFSNDAGTCQDASGDGFLSCETATATASGTNTAGGSDDGGDGSGGDSDCAVSNAGIGGDASGASLLLGAGLALSALRRRKKK